MKRLIHKKTQLIVIVVSMSLSSAAWAGSEKLSKELQSGVAAQNIDVIVQYRVTPTEAHHQKVADKGGVLQHKMDFIKAGHYSVPASALKDLANDPDVAFISPNRPVRAHLDQAAATIGSDLAYQFSVNGSGVGIALIDSGVGHHDDLINKVIYEQSFVAGSTDDLFGHGTHVAGILAGSGMDSTGTIYTRTFKGVATGVNLIDLKVLDQNGNGTDSSVIQAIQAAIALKSTYNIRVINLSLGRPVFESYKIDPLCQAVEQAWKAGIVVAVAAGNYGRTNPTTTYGYGTITAPGNDPYVITVGAMKDMGTTTKSDDAIATYSSKGPTSFDMVVKPDLVAPGNLIDSTLAPLSTFTTSYPLTAIATQFFESLGNSKASKKYLMLSGTSMATPFVSAAAALLIQQNPQITPDQVKARLMKTASKQFPVTSSTPIRRRRSPINPSTISSPSVPVISTSTRLSPAPISRPRGRARIHPPWYSAATPVPAPRRSSWDRTSSGART